MSEIGRRIVRHIRETVERRAVTATPITLPETDGQPLAEWEVSIADSLRVDVDLTKDIPCAWEGCETGASWLKTNLCCRLSNPHCTAHKQSADAWVSEWVEDGKTVYCKRCHSANHDYEWTEL